MTWTGRTLYAGLAPSRLQPGAHTYVSSPGLFVFHRRTFPDRMSIDYDRPGARIAGSLVPSRLPTTIVTSAQGPQRARLRFRRREDGGLDVLSGPELTPRRVGDAVVILRDVDGRYYVGGAGRGLEPTSQREASKAIAGACRTFGRALRVDDASYNDAYQVYGVGHDELHNRMIQIVQQRLLASLEPGAYLAVVEESPAVDQLGLDVEYLASTHLVLGRLGEEDIVD